MSLPVKSSSTQACRLCGSEANTQFVLRVLNKYNVDYLECQNCKSLQTASPFWLSETYSGKLPNLDVGAARRALKSCSSILLSCSVLSVKRRSRLLDFGGGDGFVCRLLRDAGFNSFVYDKYATNTYAEGFSGSPNEPYGVVCAMETWEHLDLPDKEIALMFSQKPEIVVVATTLYDRQGPDWSYLGPGQGGHVFFYSKPAMKWIAEQYGYHVVVEESTTVFSRAKLSPLRRFALRLALQPIGLLCGRLWLQLIKPQRDRDDAKTSPQLQCSA